MTFGGKRRKLWGIEVWNLRFGNLKITRQLQIVTSNVQKHLEGEKRNMDYDIIELQQ